MLSDCYGNIQNGGINWPEACAEILNQSSGIHETPGFYLLKMLHRRLDRHRFNSTQIENLVPVQCQKRNVTSEEILLKAAKVCHAGLPFCFCSNQEI